MKQKLIVIFLDIPLFFINYLFIVFAARYLSPDSFVQFNGYLSALGISYIVGIALQAQAAKDGPLGQTDQLKLQFLSVPWSLLVGYYASLPTTLLILLSATNFIHPILGNQRGWALYSGKKSIYYKSLYLETAVKSLGLCIVFFQPISCEILAGLYFAGNLSAATYTFITKKRWINTQLLNIKTWVQTFISQTSLYVLFSIDFLLMSQKETQYWANAALGLKISQIPAMISITLIFMSLNRSKKQYLFTQFKRMAISITMVFILISPIIIFAAHFFIPLFFGRQFTGSVNSLAPQVIMTYFFSINGIFSFYTDKLVFSVNKITTLLLFLFWSWIYSTETSYDAILLAQSLCLFVMIALQIFTIIQPENIFSKRRLLRKVKKV